MSEREYIQKRPALSEDEREDGHTESRVVLKFPDVGFVLPLGPYRHLNKSDQREDGH